MFRVIRQCSLMQALGHAKKRRAIEKGFTVPILNRKTGVKTRSWHRSRVFKYSLFLMPGRTVRETGHS